MLMKANVCPGNYYLCQIKHRCDDERECHALARAIVGAEVDKQRMRKCHVVPDGGSFRYEFETLPIYDFRGTIRKVNKRLNVWRKRAKKEIS